MQEREVRRFRVATSAAPEVIEVGQKGDQRVGAVWGGAAVGGRSHVLRLVKKPSMFAGREAGRSGPKTGSSSTSGGSCRPSSTTAAWTSESHCTLASARGESTCSTSSLFVG
eukprot:SAG31_NODE_2395_length_5790_cov_73.555614_7_plen_111_part_01